MEITRPPHNWKVSPGKAREIQRKLAGNTNLVSSRSSYRLAAGVDASFSRDQRYCLGAVVLYDNEASVVMERHTARREIVFPYIPGLLSFREAPALLGALRKLNRIPDVLICDGQGIAHPRRLGIASHLGIITRLPSVGCAKSRLVGEYRVPAWYRGARSALTEQGERIGTVLRTRQGVKPVIVSPGHKVTLDEAEEIILACCRGYRLPEPVRLADQLAGAVKKTTRS